MANGNAQEVPVEGIAWWDWALARNEIYFLNFETKVNATVKFFEFATHQIIPSGL
jgi:hypothetical protein